MADLIKDYDAKDANVRLTDQGREAMVLLLTSEGWVGVTMDRACLEAFSGRILEALSQPTPPVRRH